MSNHELVRHFGQSLCEATNKLSKNKNKNNVNKKGQFLKQFLAL